MKPDALLDSNVVVAIVAEAHQHHSASLDLLMHERRPAFAVAAHSFADAYCTLTRQGDHAPFRFPPREAWAMLESVRSSTELIGLTAAQTFDVVRLYAQSGGVGARLYDRLIGESASVHDIPVLITWNVGHMRGLFAGLVVCTPRQFALRNARQTR